MFTPTGYKEKLYTEEHWIYQKDHKSRLGCILMNKNKKNSQLVFSKFNLKYNFPLPLDYGLRSGQTAQNR